MPIVAVTANAFAEDIAATTAAGMNAHISKPIDFKALWAVLGLWQAERRKGLKPNKKGSGKAPFFSFCSQKTRLFSR